MLRHSGSAEPALTAVTEVRLVREKEKRKSQVSIHVHSCFIALKGRRQPYQDYHDQTGPSRLRRVKYQAEDCGHTGQGSPQPISSQGVCFEL